MNFRRTCRRGWRGQRFLRQSAERKLPEIQQLIERTHMAQRWLEAAAGCRCPSLDDCPLFDEEPCSTLALR